MNSRIIQLPEDGVAVVVAGDGADAEVRRVDAGLDDLVEREAVGRLARGLAVGALCKAKVGEGDMPVGVEEHLKGDNVAWIARASSHARRRCYVGWLYVAMNDAVIVEVR